MTARSPVEFTNKKTKRVGNEVVVTNSDGTPRLVDELTSALVVIDNAHHEIHEGETAIVSYKSPDASPLADNATIAFLITTGAREAHVVARLGFGGDCEIEIYEGTTYTGGTGTAMTVLAKNRNLPLRAGYATVRRDITVTGVGTLLFNFFFPGGSGGNAQGVSDDTRDEWPFKPSTNYMIRVTNRAGNAQPGALAIEWYEEPAQ